MSGSKVADLTGPGIGNYEELEKILPNDYISALTRRETQKAIFALKRVIEDPLQQPRDWLPAFRGFSGCKL